LQLPTVILKKFVAKKFFEILCRKSSFLLSAGHSIGKIASCFYRSEFTPEDCPAQWGVAPLRKKYPPVFSPGNPRSAAFTVRQNPIPQALGPLTTTE